MTWKNFLKNEKKKKIQNTFSKKKCVLLLLKDNHLCPIKKKMTNLVENLNNFEKLQLDYKFRRSEIIQYMLDKHIMFVALNDNPNIGPYWVLTKNAQQPFLTDEHHRVFWKECLRENRCSTLEEFVAYQGQFLKSIEERSIILEKVDHLGLRNRYSVEDLKQWVINGD